jgi:hypothetical protein
MSAPKGSVPWNSGKGQGWVNKRGYKKHCRNAQCWAEKAEMAELLEALLMSHLVSKERADAELAGRALLSRIRGEAPSPTPEDSST